jgi:hypothetical protein
MKRSMLKDNFSNEKMLIALKITEVWLKNISDNSSRRVYRAFIST